MSKRIALAAAVALGFAGLAGSGEAAGFRDPGLVGGGLVDPVACRVRRERVVRPNGAVVYRTVRNCGGPMMGRCRTVRERVERPNGAVVFRTRRACG